MRKYVAGLLSRFHDLLLSCTTILPYRVRTVPETCLGRKIVGFRLLLAIMIEEL